MPKSVEGGEEAKEKGEGVEGTVELTTGRKGFEPEEEEEVPLHPDFLIYLTT